MSDPVDRILVEHGKLMASIANLEKTQLELATRMKRIHEALWGPEGVTEKLTRLEQAQTELHHSRATWLASGTALAVGVLVSLIVARVEGCDRMLGRHVAQGDTP